jgi:hypothetical protein
MGEPKWSRIKISSARWGWENPLSVYWCAGGFSGYKWYCSSHSLAYHSFAIWLNNRRHQGNLCALASTVSFWDYSWSSKVVEIKRTAAKRLCWVHRHLQIRYTNLLIGLGLINNKPSGPGLSLFSSGAVFHHVPYKSNAWEYSSRYPRYGPTIFIG